MSKLIQKRFRQIPIIESLPVEKIAEMIEVSYQQYSNYQTGRHSPSVEVLERVIKKFGYSGDWFFNENIK